MKNYKFLLFAFVLLIFATPILATFAFDDDLPDKQETKTVFVMEQSNVQNEEVSNLSNFEYSKHYSNYERDKVKIYTDAINLHSQYHLVSPTKAITVKDMARIQDTFRFSNKSNQIFIASNLPSNSRRKA